MSEYAEFDPNSDDVVSREEIAHEITADVRSLARRVALQVLYQVDSSHHLISDVMRYHIVVDDVSGKVVELDADMAALVTGLVRELIPSHPIAIRLHEYTLAYDANGKLRDSRSDVARRISALVKYLEAEPDIVRLAQGVTEFRRQIDAIIQHYAPEFPIDQVAIVDRNILRLALYELGFETHTPTSVVIDEAVNLGRLFGAEGSPRFINGVLGTVAANIDTVRTTLHRNPNGTPNR